MAKWVYMFSEGDMTMRNLLGERRTWREWQASDCGSTGIKYSTGLGTCTKMVARLTTRSWHRPWKALRRWKSSMERNLAILKPAPIIEFVPVQEHPCEV